MRKAVSTWLFLIVMLVPAFALAMDSPRVEDGGGFFSADAVNRANEMIAQLKRDHGKDLFVETLRAIPDDLKPQYRPDERGPFFSRLADDRARAAKVDGVIVLIVRDPAYVQVRVGKNTIQQAFIQKDADQLQSILTTSFKNKEFDQGLLRGVEYVRDTFAQSMPRRDGSVAAPAPSRGTASGTPSESNPGAANPGATTPGGGILGGGMMSWVCVGFAVLMVIVLFRAMRSRSAQIVPGQRQYGAPGDPNMPYGQQYQGGYPASPGSGMGRGFLGGLLGGALGGYAYDRFARRPRDSGSFGGPGAQGGGSGGSFDAPSSDASDFGSGGGGGSGGDFGGGGGGGGGDGGGGGGGSGGDF